MLKFNRVIAYTADWKKTAVIAGIAGTLIAAILIFLQPFDTYTSQMSYKSLKLSGYFIPVALGVLGGHFFENAFYRKLKCQWRVWSEAVSLVGVLTLSISLCYIYLSLFINKTPLSWALYIDFGWNFALPFAFFLLPLLVYCRIQFGEIKAVKASENNMTPVVIMGNNQGESLQLIPDNFVYAKAMQNYVEVFYKMESQQLGQATLRLTLGGLLEQLPTAWQVHRSYLVNLDYIENVYGNTRKREVALLIDNLRLPISQKHYESLQKYLSNTSQIDKISPKDSF